MMDRWHARYEVTEPDDVRMTLTLTMTIAHWNELNKALPNNGEFPFWDLRRMLSEMIEHAELVITKRAED